MGSHAESSDSASTMSSSTIAPSDYTTGSSTATLVLENPSKDSGGKSSKSKGKKKDKKKRKDDKPRLPTLRPPMVFA